MPPKKQLDLNVEVDVLTVGSIAEIVNAILETLLYQRNQIPFVYKTYRYYVNKWQEQEEKESNLNGEGYNVQSFHIQRKKEQATTTKEAISSMRQIITNIFARKSIKSLRFLLGSTVFTAKEAYTVHIPTENIELNHFHEHHRISPDKLNQTLLSLLTNENLYALFSHNLDTTNTYLELELLESDNFELLTCRNAVQDSEIFPKDFSPLPPSCKDIHINLVHKQSPSMHHEELKCCKEIEVFEELHKLHMNCNRQSGKKDSIKDTNKKNLTNSSSGWWEAEVFVRGFKDQPIKGFNIWS